MALNQKSLAKILQHAETLCKQREVRLTPQRSKVLELVCAADGPIGAYEILDRLRQTIGNPAPPTVYRALDFLLEQGLIHKLESLHAYVGCSHPDHPHASQFLICSDCGDVREIESSGIADSLRQAQKNTGFKAKRPVVELLGTCARCQISNDRKV
ncbi:MAG: transcriptional repressor [Chromatiaceae bacterium]|nr:transcriptional repressor [Gammaproteobacteria bacterium]MCP5426723.1 transcriptional repressor [Chromatiaceae bacterium]MCB1872594.1 transcriptional repressor [Gammaproteobacteria bacterium]MCB1880944.1 transcriptional repressor [Gammaproteobacteria bacterium]MCB1905121.1 transcriptional repressor [Gammaproteobacteria bacterium]